MTETHTTEFKTALELHPELDDDQETSDDEQPGACEVYEGP